MAQTLVRGLRTFHNFHNIRLCSTSEVPVTKISPFEGITLCVHDPKIPVNHFYHQLIYKSRQQNALGLGDLKFLLNLIQQPEHLKYSKRAIDLYQLKGNDFSEEICALFIKACGRCNDMTPAAELMVTYKNRISAWMTAPSYHVFITTILQHQPQHLSLAAQGTKIILYKGLIPAEDTVTALNDYCSTLSEDHENKSIATELATTLHNRRLDKDNRVVVNSGIYRIVKRNEKRAKEAARLAAHEERYRVYQEAKKQQQQKST